MASFPFLGAPGPVLETFGPDALLNAETSYLDAFKPKTRSDIKPHLPCAVRIPPSAVPEGLAKSKF
jgi:hypothetical protein